MKSVVKRQNDFFIRLTHFEPMTHFFEHIFKGFWFQRTTARSWNAKFLWCTTTLA